MLKNTKPSTFLTSNGETYIRAADLVGALSFPIIILPFKGGAIPVKVQVLSQIQIRSCGDFSLIESAVRGKKKLKIRDMIEFNRLQHKIAKEALISLTFDELVKACQIDSIIEKDERIIAETRALIAQYPPGPKQQELYREVEMAELSVKFPLPNDFLSELFKYALEIGKTDIDKVSREILIEAAVLAERGHDNPADHISGVFSAFNIDDINRRAWQFLNIERSAADGNG